MKLRKIIALTLVFIMAMSTASFAATMYAPDGRTINVYDWEVTAYQNVGWYTSPVVTVYAPDGRSCVIFEHEVASWESVGWIDGRRTTTIYAPDGRTATVPTWQLQSYLNVGWYTYPVYSYNPAPSTSSTSYYYPGTTIPKYDSIVSGSYITGGYDYENGWYEYSYYSPITEKTKYTDYLKSIGFKYHDATVEDKWSLFTYTKGNVVVSVGFIYSSDTVVVYY